MKQMSRYLVISLYNENPAWIPAALTTGTVDRVIVYNKGQNPLKFDDNRIEVRNTPNIGREGETFLRYIIEDWDCMPEAVWFAQGNPFEHSPDIIDLLRAVKSYGDLPFWPLSHRFKASLSIPPNEWVDLNDAFHIGNFRCSHYFLRSMQLIGHCSFRDHGIFLIMNDFKNRYGTEDAFGYLSMRLGIARPGPITEFAYGACFYALSACIRRHPKWVYEEARKFLLETNTQGSFQGYVLERFWPYLISGRSYDCLSDCYRATFSNRPLGVWCSSRREAWLKSNDWQGVIESKDTVVCLYDGDRVRHLVGIDVVGQDKSSLKCNTLKEADDFLFKSCVFSNAR